MRKSSSCPCASACRAAVLPLWRATGSLPTHSVSLCLWWLRCFYSVFFVQNCVSVSGPGFLDEEEEDKEEEEAMKKQKIEEDEIAELRKRNWDEPFMTYEPHPSAVGWDKAHWKASDWVSWVLTGPLALARLSAPLCGPN